MQISKYNQLMLKRKTLNLKLSEIAKKEAYLSEKERKYVDPYQRKKEIQSLRLSSSSKQSSHKLVRKKK